VLIGSLLLATMSVAIGSSITAAYQQQQVAAEETLALELAQALADEVSAKPYKSGEPILTAAAVVDAEPLEAAATQTVVAANAIAKPIVRVDRYTMLANIKAQLDAQPTSNSLHGLTDRLTIDGRSYERVLRIEPSTAMPGTAVATVKVKTPSDREIVIRRLLVPDA
jgi:hypothetical protein